jgi:hypothetical protein
LLEVRGAERRAGLRQPERDPTFPKKAGFGPKCLLKLSKSLHPIIYHRFSFLKTGINDRVLVAGRSSGNSKHLKGGQTERLAAAG